MGKKSGDILVMELLGESVPLPVGEDCSATRNELLITSIRLFIEKGYEGTSVRDISGKLGIQSASIYNHFKGKDEILKAALDFAKESYGMYLARVKEGLANAQTFEDIVTVLFSEPKIMRNELPCYAFGLVTQMQFESDYAWEIYNECYIKESIEVYKKSLDSCIERGLMKQGDTFVIAEMLVRTLWTSIMTALQKLLGRKPAYESGDIVQRLENLFMECRP
jgi:AcrR family transcriptional regulator